MNASVLALDVAEAVLELEAAFPDAVSEEPDGAGGCYVTIEGIDLGEGWNVNTSSLTFHLPYNYPAAPPYPYYLPAGLRPNGLWPQALQNVHWRGSDAVQISLRHNRWDPQRDQVVGCVLQVSDWLKQQ